MPQQRGNDAARQHRNAADNANDDAIPRQKVRLGRVRAREVAGHVEAKDVAGQLSKAGRQDQQPEGAHAQDVGDCCEEVGLGEPEFVAGGGFDGWCGVGVAGFGLAV